MGEGLWKYGNSRLCYCQFPQIYPGFVFTFQKKVGLGEEGGSNTARVSLWLIEEHGYFQRIFSKNYPIKTRYIYLICIYVFILFEITNFYKWEGPLLNTAPDTPPGNPMAYTFFPKRRQRHNTPIPQKVRPLVMRWE